MQSTAALAKTTTLSVARKTLKTSSTAATCCWRDSFTSSLAVYSILTARSAPNNGFQPLRILDVHASTNSQIEHTTYTSTDQPRLSQLADQTYHLHIHQSTTLVSTRRSNIPPTHPPINHACLNLTTSIIASFTNHSTVSNNLLFHILHQYFSNAATWRLPAPPSDCQRH